ncbi:MAG: hypothetical protein FJ191_09980 [Gammaproteobacteria bacterium]|nr:hypothetical protein [Gammaproteobacteria bacterium]
MSQELQVSGLSFNDRLKWVAGLYYLNEDGEGTFDVKIVDALYPALEGLPAALVPLGPWPCPQPANSYGSQAGEAWTANHTNCSSVWVGIIDEGYMYTHEDLAANAGTNPGETVEQGAEGMGFLAPALRAVVEAQQPR